MNDNDLFDFLAISGIRESYLHDAVAFFRNNAFGDGNLFRQGGKTMDREQRISYETLLKYLRIAADEPRALEILEIWRQHTNVSEKICGDFHVHTEFSDGIDGTSSLLQEAKLIGYAWLALCDHAPKDDHTYTLSAEGFLKRREIAERTFRNAGVKAYQAIEADIMADGSLNIPPEIREDLDFALASFHYRYPFSNSKLLGLIESAFADDKVIGFAHPFFNLRPGQDDNLLLPILDLAEKHEVAVEINLAPYFLMDNLHLIREINQRNLKIMFSTDAHCRGALALMRFAGFHLDGQLDSRVLNFQTQLPW